MSPTTCSSRPALDGVRQPHFRGRNLSGPPAQINRSFAQLGGGAGLAAVRTWAERYPATVAHPRVRLEELESAGPDLLAPLAGAWAGVLVDAVRGAGHPGTLHLLELDDLASFSTGSASAHGGGVAETLALATLLEPGSMSDLVLTIGVEAGEFSLGAGLSPLVARAVESAAALIEELVQAALVGPAEAVTE